MLRTCLGTMKSIEKEELHNHFDRNMTGAEALVALTHSGMQNRRDWDSLSRQCRHHPGG